jgi:hypothetical protein
LHKLTAQGGLFEVSLVLPPSTEKHSAPLRGEIKGFSRPSRRRLLELFARMDVKRSSRAKFLTLTFTEVVTAMEAKKALRRFTMRMQREHENWSCVWRFERQRRGAPHFHLMVFNMPFVKQKLLQETWEACTREPMSIVHIKSVKNRKHAMQYVSKYVAKVSEDNFDIPAESPSLDIPSYLHADEKQGRIWGYVNKALLPFADLQTLMIDDDELAHYIRWYAAAVTHNKAGRTEYRTMLYSDDAYKMFAWAAAHARESGETVEREAERQRKWAAAHHARMYDDWINKTYGELEAVTITSINLETGEIRRTRRNVRAKLMTVELMNTKLMRGNVRVMRHS